MAKSQRPLLVVVVGLLALTWNLIGLLMFWQQVTLSPEAVAAMSYADQQIHAAMPAWLYWVFGIAVGTGILGAIGLLLGKRWAETMFMLSFLGVLVQMVSAYIVTPAWEHHGIQGAIFPVVLVAIAMFLWRYADRARAHGWLT